MIWVLTVDIDRRTFPEYKELIEELKKIPDVSLKLFYEDNFSSASVYPVIIEIHDLEWKYQESPSSITYRDDGQIQLEILNKYSYIMEEREEFVENNKKAIPLLVGFTRYALAKISKDRKYLKKTTVSQDDVTQIMPGHVKVYTLIEDVLREVMEPLNVRTNCEIIKNYGFNMEYAYPQTARVVVGSIFCCQNQCYLYVTRESQEGLFKGKKRFVIDLKGREPTEETLKEILKTRTDLLMNIEKYIRETLEKRKKS